MPFATIFATTPEQTKTSRTKKRNAMAHTTSNVSFYCRSSKTDKQGLAPIELCIIINGERTIVTLPRKEYPDVFKKETASRRDNPIKQYLDAVRDRLNEYVTEITEAGEPLSASMLKEYFKYGGAKSYTIEELFDEYLAILQKRVGMDLTPRSYRKYELARDKFYLVVDKARPLSAITSAVVIEYIATLRKEFNLPTTNGYAQRIKTVVKYGMSKGHIKINPFIGTHIRKGDSDIQFLTTEELERIRDTDFKNPAINRSRDLFVFQSSSGLSYCDMAGLVPEDIQHTPEGQAFIHKRRAKTGVFYTSVILKDGVKILESYDGHLPIISNQKYNTALKFIRDICELDKPLHSHLARHSYATRCINEGIRLEVVSKLLGHSTTRLTQHYARLLQKNIIDEVREAFEREKD